MPDYFNEQNNPSFQTKHTDKGYFWSINAVDWYPVPETSNTTDLDKELDEIILKPAMWKADDYYRAKSQIKHLILEELEYLNGVFDDELRQTVSDRLVALKKELGDDGK